MKNKKKIGTDGNLDDNVEYRNKIQQQNTVGTTVGLLSNDFGFLIETVCKYAQTHIVMFNAKFIIHIYYFIFIFKLFSIVMYIIIFLLNKCS